MTATQSQIRDALEHLDSGDISWQMWLMENSDIIRHCLQSALDTQKPAGDAIKYSQMNVVRGMLSEDKESYSQYKYRKGWNDAIEEIKTRLASTGRIRGEWRPISEAPRDGTNILLWWPAQFHCALTGHWADKYNPWIGWKVSGWSHDKFTTEPTHFMPLPAAPGERG